ncbi:MAG TPA: hypothetical protein VK797_02535 [Tepidisphaeraceae bacterium]|jgi:hypothetical protein|nr:hypothetical protein [Tepidisphaeraceae bacterium]
MKVGILSESSSDEAAIRILAEAVLGSTLEILPIRVRTRGCTALRATFSAAFKKLHWQPDADGMIVVIDSDDSPVHIAAHETTGFNDPDCRYCQMHRLVVELRSLVAPRPQAPLNVSIGLAVPAIEAWYRCGLDIHSTEAHFSREAATRLVTLRRDLKRDAYGTFRAPQSVMTKKAIEHAERLARDIPLLERQFPGGFGPLARSLRQWITTSMP